MCVNDIRAMRKVSVVQHSGNLPDANVVTFRANPNRIAWSLIGDANNLLIKREEAAGGTFWCAVGTSFEHRHLLFHVRDYGQLVTDSFTIQASGGAVNYNVIELIATPDLERVLQGEK